jgi:dipeptidyl aminopeptidase/acylaminoacyl peptidase
VIKNFITGSEQQIKGVKEYDFSPDDQSLLLQVEDDGVRQLHWFNLKKSVSHNIWSGNENSKINGLSFDAKSTRLVFSKTENNETTLWYCDTILKHAVKKVDNIKIDKLRSGFKVSDRVPTFCKGGGYICYSIIESTPSRRVFKRDFPGVNVWNFKDKLPFNQSKEIPSAEYEAVSSVKTGDVIIVSRENERLLIAGDSCAIVSDKANLEPLEYWWPSYDQSNYYLVSYKDGSRKKLSSIYEWNCLDLTPSDRYLVYYDTQRRQICSYELSSGISRPISSGINKNYLDARSEKYPFRTFPNPTYVIEKWKDNTVLFYDDFDIWQLFPDGQKAAINITNGYGRKHQIKFHGIQSLGKDSILLNAFNIRNKFNGYYSLAVNNKHDLSCLTMGPWTYSLVKAANKSRWLVLRQSATEFPNYYFTEDWRTLKPLTYFHPQKQYNWLTSELVNYKQSDGTLTQGVLYKPENFDSTKKYPIIFYYYEQLSDNLYLFPKPDYSSAIIDFPWYVSRGYLVFTPDVHYDVASVTGKVNGDYAVNSVVGAANYFARLPYVNPRKMGLNGHSFGGGETLYIITHSNLFAAAYAGAATVSDEVLSYLGVVRENGRPVASKILHSEAGHNKIGATLWQRPDLFIKASPIFRADKIITPLLLMHNLGDGACEFNQSAEMFNALRRLGKPCWLLQYDRGSHLVSPGEDSRDFTIRLQQFYDHYLKDAPPPKWMTEGIPAYLKGIENGLELDSNVRKIEPLKTYMPTLPSRKPLTVTFE